MIVIITQPLGYNYGGILQNYALQYTIKQIGYKCITYDAGYYYPFRRYVCSSVIYHICHLLGFKRAKPPKPYRDKNIPVMTGTFIKTYIDTTKPTNRYTFINLRKYKIEACIVGSDQVWRPKYNKDIRNMFLNFIPHSIKKIAYAASFGTGNWEFTEEQTNDCQKLIKHFSAVSVRELSGVQLCRQHLGYQNAKIVLDPTLLLTKDDYLKLCSEILPNKQKFLCAYILDLSEEKKHLINDFSIEYNLQSLLISAHNELSITIERWLSTFRDASLIITDSFHGTVFSIIFHKEFIVLPNKNRGIERVQSLLGMLNLTNRILSKNITSRIEPIDWEMVDSIIQKMKNDSISFLVECLKNVPL